jgi:hypothetical protein
MEGGAASPPLAEIFSVAFYVMLATATLSQADIRVALDSVVS